MRLLYWDLNLRVLASVICGDELGLHLVTQQFKLAFEGAVCFISLPDLLLEFSDFLKTRLARRRIFFSI